MDLEHLPGGDPAAKGLLDLAEKRETDEALLVSIGAPRRKSQGLASDNLLPDHDHRLYERVAREDPDSAHSRCNALLRRLTSFESARECVG